MPSWQEFLSQLREAGDGPFDHISSPDGDLEPIALSQLAPNQIIHAAKYLENDVMIAALADHTIDSTVWLDDAVYEHWARKDPQAFLHHCIEVFGHPHLRVSLMTTLIGIVVDSPYTPGAPGSTTFMYTVASSPILAAVISSLLLDTGNHLFSLCLRFIISLVPYAPEIITLHIPLLMVALGRAVCWRDRPFVDAGSTAQAAVTQTPPPRDWHVATSSMELATRTIRAEDIVQLWITVVYGAWPSNVLAFIREPVSYIRGKGVETVYAVEWEEVWTVGLLASRAGPLLRDFTLHPDLIYFNSTQELADEKRWDKLDPPEMVSRAHAIAHSDHSIEPVIENLDPVMIDLPQLQRENRLLRIEAGYAARQRKQYLYHLGRLHRHSMRFTVDEAEVHSFSNRMKEQKGIIEGLTSELTQQRREASQAQQKHSKWQEQLREKLAAFREEKRVWQSESSSMRADLLEAQVLVQRQKDELAHVKNERFKLQNQLAEVAAKVQHIEDYETRMKQLTDSQRLWDQDVRERHEAIQECEKWQGRCYQLEQLLRAQFKPEPEVVPVPRPTPPAKLTPVLDTYIAQVEAANARADRLEKENLELRAALEHKSKTPSAGDKAFIWG